MNKTKKSVTSPLGDVQRYSRYRADGCNACVIFTIASYT